MNEQIKIGKIYKHYKTGNLYKIVTVAKHSESLEDLVVYEALYENIMSKFWARPAGMFLETVEFQGKTVPRFELVESEN